MGGVGVGVEWVWGWGDGTLLILYLITAPPLRLPMMKGRRVLPAQDTYMPGHLHSSTVLRWTCAHQYIHTRTCAFQYIYGHTYMGLSILVLYTHRHVHFSTYMDTCVFYIYGHIWACSFQYCTHMDMCTLVRSWACALQGSALTIRPPTFRPRDTSTQAQFTHRPPPGSANKRFMVTGGGPGC